MKEEVDFFDLGVKYSKKSKREICIKAMQIRSAYGKEKYDEFRMGVLAAYPDFDCSDVDIDIRYIHGTIDPGIEHLRNNSYFDENATGISYKYDIKGRYKNPKTLKAKVKVQLKRS